MKKVLLSISILMTFLFANQNSTFLVSPFIDLSYDVGANNWYDDYLYYYGNCTRNGTNLALGVDIYRKPIYLQLQITNYLNYLRYDGDVIGIVKVGMNEEVYKNGYFDMSFSYTGSFMQGIHYSAYSGSVGYYHLLKPIDTLSLGYFSLGVNLGFVNYIYWSRQWNELGWYQYYYSVNYTEMYTIAEFAWITKYLRPYIAFGLQHIANSDYFYPGNSGFFSIGIQARLDNIFPYFSGNQIKMTYFKQDDYYWWDDVRVLKPNIYLYPESTMQVKVTLNPKNSNKVARSIPLYQNGWNISVEPSGKIDNKYEYLFYEGKKIRLTSQKFGWSIPFSDLWQILPQKMIEYGFNEKEIKDFVDYWQVHLPKSEFYDIFPLINKAVDKEFAVKIEPKPDNVLRVWFYIIPTNNKQNLTPPHIPKFNRNGFVVTEWGVILNR